MAMEFLNNPKVGMRRKFTKGEYYIPTDGDLTKHEVWVHGDFTRPRMQRYLRRHLRNPDIVVGEVYRQNIFAQCYINDFLELCEKTKTKGKKK